MESIDNILRGAPFSEGPDSTILADFKTKIAKLDISEADKKDLAIAASAALQLCKTALHRAITDWKSHWENWRPMPLMIMGFGNFLMESSFIILLFNGLQLPLDILDQRTDIWINSQL